MSAKANRITRADVADAAGTSVAVVSYVVNGGPRPVAKATEARVLAAIEKLGYRPNAIAQALALGVTGAYGLIVPDISNPFFAALAHALEEAASSRGTALLLGDSAESTLRERELIRTFLRRQVDGIFLVSVDEDPDYSAAIDAGVRVLVLDRVSVRNMTRVCSVSIDNCAAAYAATVHLITHGYTRIGLIGGPDDLSTARDRRAGWEAALRDHGRQVDPSWIVQSTFSRRSALEAVRPLLNRDDRPQALFVASEQQAIGLLVAAAECRLRIPEDLAVISFDGTDDAEFTVPRLSTVVQPFDVIARNAVELLIDDDTGEAVHRTCDFSIRLRPSCGPHGRR